MAITGINSSVHADKRSRQRIGVKDPSKLFVEALVKGFNGQQAKGKFKRYMDKQAIIHKSTPVVYKGYIFWHRKEVLVTVIPLHNKWKPYIKENNMDSNKGKSTGLDSAPIGI